MILKIKDDTFYINPKYMYITVSKEIDVECFKDYGQCIIVMTSIYRSFIFSIRYKSV